MESKVKLLSMTPNAKELIFAAARQCYSKGWIGDGWINEYDEVIIKDKDHVCSNQEINKLINYIQKTGHVSVLEHVKFTFAIDNISRALTHQLVRHRIASYSQQSQRYVNLQMDFDINNYIVPPKIKKDLAANLEYTHLLQNIQETYNKLILFGIKPEDARFILPNASKTRIVVTMNCVALLHFFELRCCSCAQWEIQNMANKMLKICQEQLSIVFTNAGSKCKTLGYCPESAKRTCGKYPLKEDVLKNIKESKNE